ncbi:hypothetical protein TSOC_014706, partial [Tetrabaena socialis]
SGSDVSALLTSWGTWQAAMSRPSRRPLVVEALVGSLGPPEVGAVLVDLSAGPGFFSLAAAARGHRVVAFESSARSIEAFSAAVLYNGFQDRVRLYNVSLGAAPATLCLRARGAEGAAAAGAEGAGAAGGGAGAGAAEGAVAAAAVEPEANDAEAAARRRGYGDPALHSLPQAECGAMTVRQTLAHMLMGGAEATAGGAAAAHRVAPVAAAAGATGALGGNATAAAFAPSAAPLDGAGGLAFRVGALRLSAAGWEGWVLEGAEPWLALHRPGVVLLEYAPALVARSGYPGGGVRLLSRLHELGYVHMAHAGYVCDERWVNISRALRAGGTALGEHAAAAAAAAEHGAAAAAAAERGGSGAAGEHGAAAGAGGGGAGGGPLPRQPTWCKLKPELFELLTERAHPEVAENVLLIHHTHNSVRGEPAPPASVAQQQQHGSAGQADPAAATGGAAASAAALAQAGSLAAVAAASGGSAAASGAKGAPRAGGSTSASSAAQEAAAVSEGPN